MEINKEYEMEQGDVVKFKNIVDAGDENLKFRIVEMRGDRALVEDVESNMMIMPSFVYSIHDLKQVI